MVFHKNDQNDQIPKDFNKIVVESRKFLSAFRLKNECFSRLSERKLTED
jgi:hypothetical protein